MKTLIKNGITVNADQIFKSDVLVENGTITKVAPDIEAEDAQVIDASGAYVFPGFIDTHTHFDLDLGYTRTADDFVTGSRAAVLGGTTTVLDFATQEPEGTLVSALETWHKMAEGSSCNYGFHMAIARWDDETEAELPLMTKGGVTSYKLYMVYDGLKLDDGAIYSALKAIKKEEAMVGVHCENWDVLRKMIAEVKASGEISPKGHPLSRPNAVEAEAVSRLMRIAQLADAPVYVVHLSTKEGLEEARLARQRGQEVYLESCPQYLVLTDDAYAAPDGAKVVMSPPLRKACDQSALWQAVKDGEIDFIGTDHCSFTMEQKARGKNDFSMIPNGGAGVGNRAELMYTFGVKAGKIELTDMVRLLAKAPAELFGMERHGEIKEGMAADIVVWDPEAHRIIKDDEGLHNCDNSPYAGLEVWGKAQYVLLNGETVVEKGRLTKPGRGRYIARKPMVHTR